MRSRTPRAFGHTTTAQGVSLPSLHGIYKMAVDPPEDSEDLGRRPDGACDAVNFVTMMPPQQSWLVVPPLPSFTSSINPDLQRSDTL